MSKVVLGGSRSLSRLSSLVKEELENIVSEGVEIVIGDANGADKAIQMYLTSRSYKKVTVFCSGHVCRNNLGNWKTVFIRSGRRKFDFEHYAQKDARMVEEADYGFFLWNGKSRGTLNSIRMLLKRGQPVHVYVTPKKRFETLERERDLESLLGESGPIHARSYGRRTKKKVKPVAQQPLFT